MKDETSFAQSYICMYFFDDITLCATLGGDLIEQRTTCNELVVKASYGLNLTHRNMEKNSSSPGTSFFGVNRLEINCRRKWS